MMGWYIKSCLIIGDYCNRLGLQYWWDDDTFTIHKDDEELYRSDNPNKVVEFLESYHSRTRP